MKFVNELKYKKFLISLLALLICTFVVSIIYFTKNVKGTRKSFIFPSVEEGKLVVETRRLPKKVPGLTDELSSEINYYVGELLLGPQTERCRRLFPRETRVLSCFVRDKILYVNFSAEIINPEEGSGKLPLKNAIDLFCTNVRKNYPSVSQVEVYVNGNKAYEEIK